MAPDIKCFKISIIHVIIMYNFLFIIFADDGETERDSTEQRLRSQSMINMTTCVMCHYSDTV